MENSKNFIFFIGTTAELIKISPVIRLFNDKNIQYKLIFSGQNNIICDELKNITGDLNVTNVISARGSSNTLNSFYIWFIKCLFKTVFYFLKLKDHKQTPPIVIVHGDTVSTLIGGIATKILGYRLAHIESGLRSFNFLSPFPEELTRLFTSFLVDIHFAPNSWAIENLSSNKGLKVNTYNNTLFSAMNLALKQGEKNVLYEDDKTFKYYVLVIHRQEHMYFDKKNTIHLINKCLSYADKDLKCVFVMHKLTKDFLLKVKSYENVVNTENVIITDRLPYAKFIRLLSDSEFILTDGGSNQEEAYFLGKPTLILRPVTERLEGLKTNALLLKSDFSVFDLFIKNLERYKHKNDAKIKILPEEIVLKILIEYDNKK